MNKAIYLTLILSLCLGGSLLIAKTPVNPDSTQALGLHFGNVSGNGLSYRRFFEKWGIQGVFGGYSTGTNAYQDFPDSVLVPHDYTDQVYTVKDMGRKYVLNLGVSGIYPLKKTNLFTFYVTGGFSWAYSNRKNYKRDYLADNIETAQDFYQIDSSEDVYSGRVVKSYLNMGAGPGMEIKVGPYFKLAVEIPITYTGKHEFVMYVPQVGIYYYFK